MEDAGTGLSPKARVAVLGGDGIWSLAEVLRRAGVTVIDHEPAPKQVAEAVARKWRFGRASVRAGLLGHPRAVLQLLRGDPPGWEREVAGLWLDGLRPVDPEPLALEDLRALRLAHRAALARVLAEADRLILPFCTDQAVVSGGVVWDPPLAAGGAQQTLSLDEMQRDLADLAALLRERRPGMVVQLAYLPSLTGEGEAALPQLRRLDPVGLVRDPVFDALAEAVAAGGAGAGLLAHLAQGGSLDAFAPAPAPVVEDRRAARRDKRRDKTRDKGEANRVVCEDELLEAFAK
jgi:hypothetical protein